MELNKLWKKAPDFWLKYKYVVIILAVGLLLMLLPEGSEEKNEPGSETTPQSVAGESEETRLESILAQIQGVGEVRVLLSLSKGEETVFQTDDDIVVQENSSSTKIETVIISLEDRSETGLVRQTNPPEYRGAVIVCQGGDDPVVRLAIVEAVSDITGLGSDRISVLKMK